MYHKTAASLFLLFRCTFKYSLSCAVVMVSDYFHHSVKFMQRIQVEALQKK